MSEPRTKAGQELYALLDTLEGEAFPNTMRSLRLGILAIEAEAVHDPDCLLIDKNHSGPHHVPPGHPKAKDRYAGHSKHDDWWCECGHPYRPDEEPAA